MRREGVVNKGQSDGACCAFVIVYLVFGLLGRALVDYDCTVLFGHHPPFWISFFVGIFGWGIAFPLALILLVLTACGMHSPLVHLP